jgi:hypothetical protein
VLTVGVDLAAEPAQTAVAWVEWRGGRAVVRDVVPGADDDVVLAAIGAADKAGVDCPLGWPDAFVDFVAAHRAGRVTVPGGGSGRDWRRRLALRLTDLAVQEQTGLRPLSVSADRIGYVAMRCAALLARLAQDGQPVDRGGSGVVAEVYPAASLKAWGLPYRRYKGRDDAGALGELVDQLLAKAPWLDCGRAEALCRGSHDVTDALIAALTARAASLHLTRPPTAGQARAAATEGWVAIPAQASLARLPGPAS